MNLQEGYTVTDNLVKYANMYSEARMKAAQAKIEFEILLTNKMTELLLEKKNAGIETLSLMLISREPVAEQIYKDWKSNEARYKSIQRILDANQTKVSYLQSVMRHEMMMGG